MLSVNTHRPLFWFLGTADVTSMADLRGRRLAVHAAHTAPGCFARIVLRKHGLNPTATWNVWCGLRVTTHAATTQAAVASAPPQEQARAGMANVVRTVAADVRVGRLLFSVELSNTVIVRKRAESTALFAKLLFQHAGALGAQDNDLIKAAAHFAVGGVGQTVSAWLSGEVKLDPEQLIARLAALLDQLAAIPN